MQEWAGLAATAGALATLLDALLLQRRNNIFTGGFLAVDHLRGPVESLVFLLVSFLTDAAGLGLLVALALWLAARLRLGRLARRGLALVAALGPVVASDALAYEIFTHLGGAFDLGLMFDLAGRRPAEVAAVAGTHLTRLAALGIAGLGALAGAVWLAHRWRPEGAWHPATCRPGPRVAVALPAVFALLGTLVGTAARLQGESLDNALRRKPTGKVFGALVTALSDFDRDGYGVLSLPADPAPRDAGIHPYAADWPGNGVDENGLGGDLPATAPRYSEERSAPPRWTRQSDVVLFVLESFRADAVGAMLEGRSVTPTLDELARRGVSSPAAYSHNGYTVQSRFHLFSGSLANLRDGTTLIDDFRANGYETAYFSGQDESFGGSELPVGFERASVFYEARQDRTRRYTRFTTPGSLAVAFDVVEARVGAFLAARREQRPLFLYVNFHDTHFPYHHGKMQPLVSDVVVPQGEIGPDRAEPLRRMYLNAAANVDAAIGRVLARVTRATGREPAVVVTADHGESLFDEGFLGHGYALNDAQTRVPLIVANLGLEVREPWGQADLRGGLRAALARSDPPQPTRSASGRGVFQYLGRLSKPRQIALSRPDGRGIYDFREDRFRLNDGPWRRPADLSGTERAVFLHLVHGWESMMVAVASERGGSP